MSLARLAKRRDANERAIIDALERVGAEVWITDRPADLIVWRAGQWAVLEVKSTRGRFTARQSGDRAEGLCGGIQVVRTPLEALQAVGVVKVTED